MALSSRAGRTASLIGRGLLALVLVAATPTAIESARWWHSPRMVATLDLSAAQRDAIERLYQGSLPERMARAAQANAAHEALNRLMEASAPEAEVEAAASMAADADAARARTRALMLYRMLRILTPEQRRRLAPASRYARLRP